MKVVIPVGRSVPKKHTAIYIDQETWAHMAAIAKDNRTSINKVCIYFIELGMNAHAKADSTTIKTAIGG